MARGGADGSSGPPGPNRGRSGGPGGGGGSRGGHGDGVRGGFHGRSGEGRAHLGRARRGLRRRRPRLARRRPDTRGDVADAESDVAMPRSPRPGPRRYRQASSEALRRQSSPGAGSRGAVQESTNDGLALTRDAMPDFVDPMLATLVAAPFDDRRGCSRSSGTASGSKPSCGSVVRLWTRGQKDAEGYFGPFLTPPTWSRRPMRSSMARFRLRCRRRA